MRPSYIIAHTNGGIFVHPDKANNEPFVKAAASGIAYILLYWVISGAVVLFFLLGYVLLGDEIALGGNAEEYASLLGAWVNQRWNGIAVCYLTVEIAVFLCIIRKKRLSSFHPGELNSVKTVCLVVGITVTLAVAVNYTRYYILASGVFSPSDSAAQSVSTGTLPVRLLKSVVLAPIAEEFVFHGAAFPRMCRGMSKPVAAILVSILFALSHFGDALTTAYALFISLVILFVMHATRSLLSGILMHLLYNLTCIATEYIPVTSAACLILAIIGIVTLILLLVCLCKQYQKPDQSNK